MLERSSRVPWISIVVAGVAAFVISFIATFLIVGVYAFVLAFQVRGAPDPTKINAFANQVAPLLSPLLLTLLVIFAAHFVVSRTQAPRVWYGALIGLIATLPALAFTGIPNLVQTAGLLLPVAGGMLGAYVAMRPQRVDGGV